jgi:hypothetical protein
MNEHVKVCENRLIVLCKISYVVNKSVSVKVTFFYFYFFFFCFNYYETITFSPINFINTLTFNNKNYVIIFIISYIKNPYKI